MKVENGNGVLDDFFAKVVIPDAVGSAVIEATAGEDEAEGAALVTATAAVVEVGRASELGAGGDEGLSSRLFFSKSRI